MKQKGFTLIELLVVIAIIGILASVVLASLNSARGKGADAATKSGLANARAQAELYYDGNTSSYATVCTAANGIGTIIAGAASAAGISSVTSPTTLALTQTTAGCNSSATAWAAAVPLKTSTTQAWCVDSTGKSTATTTTSLAAGFTAC